MGLFVGLIESNCNVERNTKVWVIAEGVKELRNIGRTAHRNIINYSFTVRHWHVLYPEQHFLLDCEKKNSAVVDSVLMLNCKCYDAIEYE